MHVLASNMTFLQGGTENDIACDSLYDLQPLTIQEFHEIKISKY